MVWCLLKTEEREKSFKSYRKSNISTAIAFSHRESSSPNTLWPCWPGRVEVSLCCPRPPSSRGLGPPAAASRSASPASALGRTRWRAPGRRRRAAEREWSPERQRDQQRVGYLCCFGLKWLFGILKEILIVFSWKVVFLLFNLSWFSCLICLSFLWCFIHFYCFLSCSYND